MSAKCSPGAGFSSFHTGILGDSCPFLPQTYTAFGYLQVTVFWAQLGRLRGIISQQLRTHSFHLLYGKAPRKSRRNSNSSTSLGYGLGRPSIFSKRQSRQR